MASGASACKAIWSCLGLVPDEGKGVAIAMNACMALWSSCCSQAPDVAWAVLVGKLCALAQVRCPMLDTFLLELFEL